MPGLSRQACEDLEFLGKFAPTIDGKTFKGWMLDPDDGGATKVYLHASDFRNLAASCAEVAEWLEPT